MTGFEIEKKKKKMPSGQIYDPSQVFFDTWIRSVHPGERTGSDHLQ